MADGTGPTLTKIPGSAHGISGLLVLFPEENICCVYTLEVPSLRHFV